jgi:hypothetical protein
MTGRKRQGTELSSFLAVFSVVLAGTLALSCLAGGVALAQTGTDYITPVGKCGKFDNAWIFTAIKVFRLLIHM